VGVGGWGVGGIVGGGAGGGGRDDSRLLRGWDVWMRGG
jgi:hypothetical protein